MEKCNPKVDCLSNHVVREARKGLLDKAIQLPIQVGRPDFTRLRDRADTIYHEPRIVVLTNAFGGVNDQVLTHTLDSNKLAFYSSDAQWTAQNVSNTSYRLIGPEGETFLGQLTALKPE